MMVLNYRNHRWRPEHRYATDKFITTRWQLKAILCSDLQKKVPWLFSNLEYFCFITPFAGPAFAILDPGTRAAYFEWWRVAIRTLSTLSPIWFFKSHIPDRNVEATNFCKSWKP